MNFTEYLIQSFLAFNQNGISHLGYLFQQNYFIFLLIGCLIATIIIRLKEEIDVNPTEERMIL